MNLISLNTIATDDFERSSLGANWEIAYPTGGDAAQVQILGNSDLGMTAGAQAFFLVDWVANTFSDNQFSTAVISSETTMVSGNTVWAFQVYVRRRLSDGARYGFGYDNDPSQPQYQRWYIKYDGVPNIDVRYFGLSNIVPLSQAPKPGDTLRIEVVGYTVLGYFNDVLVLTATDTDPTKIASGRPGLASRIATGNSSNPSDVKIWESFTAGNIIT